MRKIISYILFKGNEPAFKIMQTGYFALYHDRSIHMNNDGLVKRVLT